MYMYVRKSEKSQLERKLVRVKMVCNIKMREVNSLARNVSAGVGLVIITNRHSGPAGAEGCREAV